MEFEAWSIHPDRLTKEPRLYLERLPALKGLSISKERKHGGGDKRIYPRVNSAIGRLRMFMDA